MAKMPKKYLPKYRKNICQNTEIGVGNYACAAFSLYFGNSVKAGFELKKRKKIAVKSIKKMEFFG